MHLHTNTHQYTHKDAHSQTHTDKYTDTCIFLYFFPLVAGDKLGNELQFFNLFAATGRKQFCGRPLPGPAELLSPFHLPLPSRLLLRTQSKPKPKPIAVSIGKFLAVSSRREKLSAIPFRELFNYHIAFFARSSSFCSSISCLPPLPS